MLLKYRKDIDGLRAIAVLLVVFFHAGFPISGGFIGVDIFFVISGFLIASLIQKQILADKFSFTGFYVHRIRRILPAFLFISFISLILGWFYLLPDYYEDTIRSIFYSLIQYSNFFYLKITGDYFSANAEHLLFLHTWSLSVETQFYIIIPLLLIALFKFTYKTKYFNYVLIVTLIASLALSEYMAMQYKLAAYYLLPSRFFELLMGVTLALNYAKLPVIENKPINNLLAVFAGLLIFVPAFILSKTSLFPGLNAFYPCLGACIIIYLGKSSYQSFLTKILSLKPMFFIGLISYSLYLWHWVVLVMFRLIGLELSLVEKLFAIAGMIVLSLFTWKFVEQPFRKNFKWGLLKTFLILILIPALAMQVSKIAVKKTNGFMEQRFSQEAIQIVKTQKIKTASVKTLCHNNFNGRRSVEKSDCFAGDENSKTNVLLFGDSLANAMAVFTEELLKDAKLKAFPFTSSGFTYLKGIDFNENTHVTSLKQKLKYSEKLIEEIESKQYKYIMIAGMFSKAYEPNPEIFYPNLVNTIELILANNAIPVIIKETVDIDSEMVLCSSLNKLFNLSKKCEVKLNEIREFTIKANAGVDKLKQQYQDKIIVIDPNKVICKNNICKLEQNNIALYYDTVHLSLAGAKYLGHKYLTEYGNPFKKFN